MMRAPLRDAPGWAAALKESEHLYGHAFSPYEFAVVGSIILPDNPAGVSTALILDALRLVSTARRARAPVTKRVEVKAVHPHSGPATNVIECWFNQRENRYLHDGLIRAQVQGEFQVRDMIRSAYRSMVSNIAVSNDNDPAVSESPWFGVKVQSAWVRECAARRGAAQ